MLKTLVAYLFYIVIYCCLGSLGLLSSPKVVFAIEIQIIDVTGKPVKNSVISVDPSQKNPVIQLSGSLPSSTKDKSNNGFLKKFGRTD